MKRKVRMGMVGGGQGAFIGNVHRMAAALDGKIELVCGAFNSDPLRAKASGAALLLDPDRVYGSFEEMFQAEAKRPMDDRMDFVSIVTPNHLHFAPAKAALENGFHVVCDKPLCFNLEEARQLKKIAERENLLFAVTYNYTGYPMVKEARHLVQSGHLGRVRKVFVEYHQGWLHTLLEATDQKQAAWRTDPNKSGEAGSMGDIGSHAENLMSYVTGLTIEAVCADISTLVNGRLLDDDGSVLIRFTNGARGVLSASQICTGEENNLRIRVYGEKGGIEWNQMEPNTLLFKDQDKGHRVIRTGNTDVSKAASDAARLPAGHPEGYIEAFANLYKAFAESISARIENRSPDASMGDFPNIEEGVRGMYFISKVIASGRSQSKWVKM